MNTLKTQNQNGISEQVNNEEVKKEKEKDAETLSDHETDTTE